MFFLHHGYHAIRLSKSGFFINDMYNILPLTFYFVMPLNHWKCEECCFSLKSHRPKWKSLPKMAFAPNLKGDPLHRPIGPIGQGLNTPIKGHRDIYRLFYSNKKTEDQKDDR